MERIEIITAPATTSVSVASLKQHLRLVDSAEDALLLDYLKAADDLFMRQTGYVLTPCTLRMTTSHVGTVYVPRHPVTGIISVETVAASGLWQTVTGSLLDTLAVPARVDVSGPSYQTVHGMPACRVTFPAGTASPPALACQAVRLLAAHWYARREAYTDAPLDELPAGWRYVCDQFRTGLICSLNGGC